MFKKLVKSFGLFSRITRTVPVIFLAANLHAVTVDVFQNCEGGNPGDPISSAVMNAYSRGTSTWTYISSGTICISTRNIVQLPGVVTVGGVDYTDTGNHSWVCDDQWDRTWARVDLKRSPVNKITIACFLTMNVTSYYHQYDTIIFDTTQGHFGVLATWHWSGQTPLWASHSRRIPPNNTSTFSYWNDPVHFTIGHTYWVNLHIDGTNATCKIAVFDPSNNWAQVGVVSSTDSFSVTGFTPSFCGFGRTDAHGDYTNSGGQQTYYDDIMIDYTNAAFPLLPDGVGGVDTSSPSAPAIVYDGTATGVDTGSTFSTTTLSANWSIGADAESGISGYRFAVGTTAGGTNIKTWTTIGNVLSTTTAVNLTMGATYYFSVKSVNTIGLISTGTASSNGQYVTTDGTPPTAPGVVRDGTGSDVDSSTSLTQLSANWTAGADAESGISGYQYAIGTTAGGTQTLGWQTLGVTTTVTRGSLSLSVGSTYYFTVKSVNGAGLPSDTATNSNGVVVVSTADTSAPIMGAVRDGTGTDISNTQTSNTLSANWTPATDPESGITAYQYAIGTTAGGTNTAAWTTLGYNYNSVTRSTLTLVTGTTYYFSVKAVNGNNLTSTAVNSNGQYVVAIDTSDITPPSNIVAVRDGTGADVDYVQATTLTTQLSANWDASADAESGIARYWYAIGTMVGGANTQGWANNGQATAINISITLAVNTTYYVSVKAENNVGLQSSTTTSSGFVVLPLDTLSPYVSGVTAQGITSSGVTIVWTTDEGATTLVEYGRTTAYGTQTIEDISLTLNHSASLTGLIEGSEYHYRVISRDASNNQTTSADYTFTTLVPAAPIGESIHAYPNPCKVSAVNPVKFRLPNSATSGEVNIYTVSGRLIKTLGDSTAGEIIWDGRNSDSEKAGRGIYIYKITSSAGDSIIGKIALK